MRSLRHAITGMARVLLAPAAALIFAAAGPSALGAQAPPPDAPGTAPVPQIVTSATEEVEITPDRASIVFTVETRARTAAAAGAENARIQAAVLDTLRKLGIQPAQLRTQGLSIQPEYEYPREGGRPTVVGYQARNSVRAELRDVARVGPTIDAGLARGATRIGSLRFFASSTEEAGREALRKAVARARADADAVAEAAGGRITGVIEITVQQNHPVASASEVMMMSQARAVRADQEPTPIEGGSITVSQTVYARFRFAPR